MGKGNCKPENTWWRHLGIEEAVKSYLGRNGETSYSILSRYMRDIGLPRERLPDSLANLERDGTISHRKEESRACIDHFYKLSEKGAGPKGASRKDIPSSNGRCEFISGMLIGEAETVKCTLYKNGMLTINYKSTVCKSGRGCDHKELLKKLMKANLDQDA